LLLALESFGRTPARHPADSHLVSVAIDELLGRIQRIRALRALADNVYAQYLQQTSASCFVDKTPRYWLVLEFLEALYPETPTLVLLRNPYAIAASLKSTWGIRLTADADRSPQAPYIADLALGLRALLEHTERHPSLTIHYEQLVRAPAAEQTRALAHLRCSASGLPSSGTLLDHSPDNSSFGDTKIRKRRVVNSASLDAWQHQLTREELQVVTELLGEDLLNRLGYGEEFNAALRLGARSTSPERTDQCQGRWRKWLATNCAVVRHAGSWPAVHDQPHRRIEQLEEQAATFHDSAANTERLLKECNEHRQQLQITSHDTHLQLQESNRDREQLLAWAQQAESRVKESESERKRLLAWAEEGERLLKECNEDRRQLRAWAEDAERRASK